MSLVSLIANHNFNIGSSSCHCFISLCFINLMHFVVDEFGNTHSDIPNSHSLVVLSVIFCLTGSMENSNLRASVDEEIVMKTGKVAGIGLAAGSVWGALVSMLYDGPQVGSNVKYPQLIRTGKVCGHYAASFAVIGATYVGVEKALEKYRMKKDIFNGVAAGFATGAVMGFRGTTSCSNC